jgi:hypothetical protein
MSPEPRSLGESIDTATPTGRLIFHVFVPSPSSSASASSSALVKASSQPWPHWWPTWRTQQVSARRSSPNAGNRTANRRDCPAVPRQQQHCASRVGNKTIKKELGCPGSLSSFRRMAYAKNRAGLGELVQQVNGGDVLDKFTHGPPDPSVAGRRPGWPSCLCNLMSWQTSTSRF